MQMSSAVPKRPRDQDDSDATPAKRQNQKLRIKIVARVGGSDRDEKKMLTCDGGVLVGALRELGAPHNCPLFWAVFFDEYTAHSEVIVAVVVDVSRTG